MKLWIKIKKILGLGADVELKHRILHLAATGMICSGLSGIILIGQKLPIVYKIALPNMIFLCALTLLLDLRYKKYEQALMVFFINEFTIVLADYLALGGITGAAPVLLILCHIFNYNILDRKHYTKYFIISNIIVFLAIVYNFINPEISATLPLDLAVRSVPFISVNLMASVCMLLFKKQEHEQKEKISAINKSQQQLIKAIEKDFFLVKYNERFKINYKSDSIKTILNMLPKEEQEAILYELPARNKENHSFEKRIFINQQQVYLRINQHKNYNTLDGEFYQIIVQDITHQKAHEKQLTTALNKELELNKSKSEFISMVSHQFRTPLTTIHSANQIIEQYISVLKESEQGPILEKKFGQIYESIESITGMMERLLDYGKMEADELYPFFKPTSLVELIEKQIERYQALNPDREFQIKIKGEARPVKVDPYFIEHILMNLISNAIKYSEAKIELSLSFLDQEFLIKVKDHGMGIAQEEINKLFEPFYRSKQSENIKGTGIGLSFVKKFVELHQGTIEVQSTLNQGASFIIYIPYESQYIDASIEKE
ncbi:HAMP domain-containing sensor histidine kinase [Persicobacter psychrovividus]|uniref:histidine kinase n=1 Tax=Persicobacter psychrovividus TaxID=387638 RepID=A0ABM7VLN5_9BACT|nr:hypothetical protein PEPS_41830 [Persicobacter psychrovividus]